MFIIDYFEKLKDEKIKLYVDMDGVIADYDVGVAYEYDQKRPLYSNIEKLEIISKMENVNINILSITRYTRGIEEKNTWLDKFAPFFEKEKRNIISRELNNMRLSADLKVDFVKGIERDGSKIIIIDDDPAVIHAIRRECEDVVLLKDSALVD